MSRRGRRGTVVLVALACLAATLAVATPAGAADRGRPEPVAKRVGPDPVPAGRARPTTVGTVQLRPCDVVERALCGVIRRPWDPARPGLGRVRVGFAFVPARDRSRPVLGTVVPHEGGPGYSTTGTGSSYAQMYGPLLQRRHLLLVDQRATGLSQPIRCADLQDLRIAYHVAAGRCGRQLKQRADKYTTALSADDLAVVINRLGLGQVDVYGDSYGTFFAQVFTGRHPGRIRSVVLDSAYPTYGESAWYPTQTPTMRRAFDLACLRSVECRSAGRAFLPTMRRVLSQVRRAPWRGVSHDADGTRTRVVVNAPNLATVAFGATYAPAFYRELTAALRSGLRGDRAPLLRLVAEALGGGTDAGDPVAYSEGLDAAVACHDYPQLYDMRARPAVRERQYAAAIAQRSRTHPATYGPFTVREYARSDWQMLDWCLRWPTAPASNPAGPPMPPGGYPAVPVLILSGEMDSITTAAEGDIVDQQFPDAQHVVVRNGFHVNAIGDTEDCAQRLVRAFVRTAAPVASGCASRVAPVRSLGVFPRGLRTVRAAQAAPGVPVRLRRAGTAAALTVADLQDRWWNNYSGIGVGLRGGTWSYGGSRTVRFDLDAVRLVRGVRVSGSAVWDRYGQRMRVQLRLGGRGPDGRLAGGWNTRRVGAEAVLTGRLDGRRVRLTFPAP